MSSRRSICLFLLAIFVLVGVSPGSAQETATERLRLHEELIEAWRSNDSVDLDNPRAILWYVFSRFPTDVRIYPSENYYYWQLSINGRELRGNFRLSAKDRDQGFVHFAYSEARAPTEKDGDRIRVYERFGEEQGVTIKKAGAAIYDVGYSDHFVRFHLEDLPQVASREGSVRSDEILVGRTQDESGLGFLLLFQTKEKYFFWVLDESQPITDHFVAVTKDSVVGRRTGFAFWVESSGRKVLAAVQVDRVTSNSYFDGPFDQLPDNHIANKKVELQKWMEEEDERLKGKIDDYGYFLADDPPRRVALVRYATYKEADDLLDLMKRAAVARDVRQFFARQGK